MVRMVHARQEVPSSNPGLHPHAYFWQKYFGTGWKHHPVPKKGLRYRIRGTFSTDAFSSFSSCVWFRLVVPTRTQKVLYGLVKKKASYIEQHVMYRWDGKKSVCEAIGSGLATGTNEGFCCSGAFWRRVRCWECFLIFSSPPLASYGRAMSHRPY